jgi:hypothetical protein
MPCCHARHLILSAKLINTTAIPQTANTFTIFPPTERSLIRSSIHCIKETGDQVQHLFSFFGIDLSRVIFIGIRYSQNRFKKCSYAYSATARSVSNRLLTISVSDFSLVKPG